MSAHYADSLEHDLMTYLLLELLVDSVTGILDGHTLVVSSRDLKPEREVQVDLLDRWVA